MDLFEQSIGTVLNANIYHFNLNNDIGDETITMFPHPHRCRFWYAMDCVAPYINIIATQGGSEQYLLLLGA